MNGPITPGERLTRAAKEVAQLRRRIADDRDLATWTRALKQWQSARLARTHRDYLDDPRYRDAARFFLDDLYGAKDFSQRDGELIRVIPTLTRTLPEQALDALADAVELDALSERLDEQVAVRLRAADSSAITEQAYAQAFREAGSLDERHRQLALVERIGTRLVKLVRHPLLGGLLKTMAVPARLAGVSTLHDFLVRGFSAFRAMGSEAARFVEAIERRERGYIDAMFEAAIPPPPDEL